MCNFVLLKVTMRFLVCDLNSSHLNILIVIQVQSFSVAHLAQAIILKQHEVYISIWLLKFMTLEKERMELGHMSYFLLVFCFLYG